MYLREHTINAPEEGTCTWLLRQEDFQKWLGNQKDPPNRRCALLWLKGKPGSGKSSLMKTTMLSLQSGERLIARFFFDQRSEIELNRSSYGLFRSIIYQLVSQDEGLRQCFLAMHSHRAPTLNPESAIKWTSQDLKSMLRILIMSNQAKSFQILILIDAIDECERTESRDLLMYFRGLVESANSNNIFLRICVSSRPFLHISVSNCFEITVDALNQGDIVAYISRRLSMSGVPDDEDWRRVNDAISQKAKGVFLWAVLTTNLALDYHDQGESMETIHRRLALVPPQLADLYAEILRDLNYDCFVTYRFFQWAILSTTSLRLREWYQILPLIHQQEPPARFSDLQDSEGFAKSDDQLEQKIRIISRGLVEVVRAPTKWGYYDEAHSEVELRSVLGEAGSLDLEIGETRGVQVIHESVRHFFLYQNGFAVLLKSCNQVKDSGPAWIRDTPSTDAPLKDILIHGHRFLMKTCIEYQQLAELDALVRARASAASRLLLRRDLPKSSRKGTRIKRRKKMKKREKKKKNPGRFFKSKRPSISFESSSRSSSASSILSFASAGSSVDMDRESRSQFVSRNRELQPYLRSRNRDNKGEPHPIMLRRYIEQIQAGDSTSKCSPPPGSVIPPAAPSTVSNASNKTIAQQAFLSLQYYSTTQLFVHAKLAEDLGAKPHSKIFLSGPHWTRIMLLQENYRLPNILEFCIDIDLPSWVMVLLERRGSYSTRGAVVNAFRRAFDQDSPETMSAIVVEDFKRASWDDPGWSILDHIISSDRLDLVYAWCDIVSTGLRLKSISPSKLEPLVEAHQVRSSIEQIPPWTEKIRLSNGRIRPPRKNLPLEIESIPSLSEYDDYPEDFPSELQEIPEIWENRYSWLSKSVVRPTEKPHHHENVPGGIDENNQSVAAVLERELANFLGYLPSLRPPRARRDF